MNRHLNTSIIMPTFLRCKFFNFDLLKKTFDRQYYTKGTFKIIIIIINKQYFLKVLAFYYHIVAKLLDVFEVKHLAHQILFLKTFMFLPINDDN